MSKALQAQKHQRDGGSSYAAYTDEVHYF